MLLFILSMLVTGVVLFIVFAVKKKFVFEAGQTAIPRQVKLSIALGNAGMGVFGLFWLAQIIGQLFA